MKNDHTNNPNNLNPELFIINQDHHKRSLSHDDHDLCTTYSASSHETLCMFLFLMKKEYAKYNRPFFKFSYSTSHYIEKKQATFKDQKHITILLSDNENTPISNYSNSKFENNELDSNNNRNINKK